ncbi:MAG: DNA-3-methyladenine glycosylase I [Caulobacterales bacterium]|nr:DNA-3-methyladenine glycosylase I [Caulobacterales bacterium]
MSEVSRCGWVPADDALYCAYHDDEWGVPERDDRALFEKLLLDGMQAGLSWRIILVKRDDIRAAFDGFEPERLARWGEKNVEKVLANPKVIRSRLKTAGAVKNAHAYLKLKDERGSFSDFLWDFVDGETVRNTWTRDDQIPTKTPASEAMAKELKRRGFTFCGPVIVYAFMQAVGMVNDHLTSCFRHEAVSLRAKG